MVAEELAANSTWNRHHISLKDMLRAKGLCEVFVVLHQNKGNSSRSLQTIVFTWDQPLVFILFSMDALDIKAKVSLFIVWDGPSAGSQPPLLEQLQLVTLPSKGVVKKVKSCSWQLEKFYSCHLFPAMRMTLRLHGFATGLKVLFASVSLSVLPAAFQTLDKSSLLEKFYQHQCHLRTLSWLPQGWWCLS